MSTRTVAVAHRERMLAEGIAAALGRFPGIAPVAATDDMSVVAQLGPRIDAAAIDVCHPRAGEVADVLRRSGVRIVFVGEQDPEGGLSVPTSASVAALATALAPGVVPAKGPPTKLTAREREVMSLVAKGLVGKQIARRLAISPKTVERHKTRIFSKLGVPNQAAAVSVTFGSERGAEPWIQSST